ncbi:SAG family member [Eimeria mitis]|uniref:SAG family member n=1 Tax=Eimeria mitis TaxID=44415 RepID=U6KJE1_9EIME|nr:SAG family member [Eimeria mitis]CDJ36906.1 SAG family member [Eimeria mitis]
MHLLGQSGASLQCLTQMNEARAAAGLPDLKESEDLLPITGEPGRQGQGESDFWSKLCAKVVATPAVLASSEGTLPKGTYAYFATVESEGDCAAAVEYWKGGFSLFEEKLPEKYSQSEPKVYANAKAVSFVALFNPKPDPTVSCAFVKCPATTTTTTKTPEEEEPTEPSGGSSGGNGDHGSNGGNGGGGGGRRLAQPEATSTFNAIVCITSPEALLDDQAPFSQEVWDKIAAALSSGISSALPAVLLALSAVSLSASLSI